MKLVDVPDSKSGVLADVSVRLRPRAPRFVGVFHHLYFVPFSNVTIVGILATTWVVTRANEMLGCLLGFLYKVEPQTR